MSQLAFGPFTLDLRTSALSKDGALTPLSPKLVQVLACLAEARGELVTRDLLFERFWPGLTVTDNTLTRAIADIRKTLDDPSATPVYIQTIARRGYRFVATVREEAPVADAVHAGAVPVSDAFAGLEPFVAWERGRTALESLHVSALPAAAEAFSRAVSGAPHYAAAHVFVLPSYNEGMSVATLEAMAAGLPVIITRTGGTAELVEEGVNGLTFDWADVNALVAHIKRFTLERALARSMGAASRQRAALFSWEAAAQTYLHLIHGLAAHAVHSSLVTRH